MDRQPVWTAIALRRPAGAAGRCATRREAAGCRAAIRRDRAGDGAAAAGASASGLPTPRGRGSRVSWPGSPGAAPRAPDRGRARDRPRARPRQERGVRSCCTRRGRRMRARGDPRERFDGASWQFPSPGFFRTRHPRATRCCRRVGGGSEDHRKGRATADAREIESRGGGGASAPRTPVNPGCAAPARERDNSGDPRGSVGGGPTCLSWARTRLGCASKCLRA
jgi:hypothetical protein